MAVFEQGQSAYSQADESENVLGFREIIRIIWSRIWVILLIVFVLVGATVSYSLIQTPTYESSVKILVGQSPGVPSNLANEIDGVQRLTKTLTEAVKTRPVAEDVIEQLNLEMTPETLLNNLKAQPVGETQFIQVRYSDTDPERAEAVANATGEVISELLTEVSADAYGVTATVWEPATVPGNPATPNWQLNVLLALVVGAALGLGVAFLLEYLDDDWRSPEEAERISGVPNFGEIPSFAVPKEALKNEGKEREQRKMIG